MSAKVQAYLVLALAIITGAGPKVAEAFMDAGLPQWAHVIGIIVSLASAVALAHMPAAQAKVSKVSPPLLMLVGSLACVAWLSAYQASCTPAQSANPAVVPSVNFAVCVLGTAAEDVAAGRDIQQIVTDAIAKCGGDAIAVGQVLDAHKNAEIREGCTVAAKAK
jgi:hypothetical protein